MTRDLDTIVRRVVTLYLAGGFPREQITAGSYYENIIALAVLSQWRAERRGGA